MIVNMLNYFKRKHAVKAYQQALAIHQKKFVGTLNTPLMHIEEGNSLLNVLHLYIECLRLGAKP